MIKIERDKNLYADKEQAQSNKNGSQNIESPPMRDTNKPQYKKNQCV
jgi:hypothetical protein